MRVIGSVNHVDVPFAAFAARTAPLLDEASAAVSALLTAIVAALCVGIVAAPAWRSEPQ
jgi:hypothetical protein